MLNFAPTVRVFVAVEPLDMRGSFDALAGAVRRLALDPTDGHVYLFLSRRRQLLKALSLTASFQSTIDALTQQVAQLNERVAELLAAAQRRQRKSAPAKDPPTALSMASTVPAALKDRPSPPVLPERPSKSATKHKPTGRKSLPSHLEAETTTLRPETCASCGGVALDAADEVVEEKLHVVKEHQRRRVVRRTTCRCRACGERTTPRSLPAPYGRSKSTCEWLA